MDISNPYHPPVVAEAAPIQLAPADPANEGIRGWLILVAFGVLISPFTMLRDIIYNYRTLFVDGTWTQMTTQGSDLYHPFWAPFLCAEISINVVMLLVWTYMIYLLFSKKKAFPKWYIRAQAASLVILVADALALQVVRPDMPLVDAETRKALVQTVVSVCVWVPYMLVSKRVKATFRF